MHKIKNVFRKLSSGAVALSTVLALSAFLFTATPAFAGIGVSVTPDFPGTIGVGQTAVPASLNITNNSSADVGNITLTSVLFTPSCGDFSSIPCDPSKFDPGVFSLSPTATGAGACVGQNFTLTIVNPASGQIQFTPPPPPILLNIGATCTINFTFDVLKTPTKDAAPLATNIQTAQIAQVEALDQTQLPGAGSGTDITTVTKASPSISTTQSAGGPIGTMLNDTATLTGGSSPTGSVTFKLFPPADSTCSGAASYTDIDPSAAYATSPGFASNASGVWHWTADYAGDANNNATSSSCTAEPVTIVPKGHIIVDKITVPAADPQSFAFTTTGTGYSGFSLTDAAVPNDQMLDAGTFTVGETAVSGWDITSANCVSSTQDVETPASINLQAGETVTCTFTNTKKGHLLVQKTTDPALDPTSFTINASGNGTITGSAAGTVTDAADKNYEVTPGTYSVAETVPAGWDKTGDTCQGVEVTAGATSTCLLTNVKRGHVIIVKDAVPNNAQDFVFTNNFGNSNPVNFSLDDDSDNTLSNTKDSEVLPGTFSVSEGIVAGWDQTSATCSDQSPVNAIVVSAGETVTCTFVNTLQSGHLVVQKTTIPAADPTSFVINASGTGTITGSPAGSITDATDQIYAVTAGTYNVAETVPSGWTKTGDTCQGVVVTAGATSTCLITNTKKGHIIVDKITNPSGNSQSFAFTTTGSGYSSFGLTDAAAPNNQELVPGAYSVSEGALAGWTSDGGVCDNQQTPASINLAAGQTVTCTFTNTLQSGHLIVQKTTIPAADPTSFVISASGSGTITGGGAGSITDATDQNYEVTSGTYSVNETLPLGWTQSSNTCNGVVVGPGETKTCVITNTKAVQYCSPGYWKQDQHFDNWVGYTPEQKFSSVFEGVTILWSAKGKPGPVSDPTLLQVLEANGGGINSLARAAVDALLNAAKLNSGYTTQQVVDAFNAAYPGTDTQYEALKAQFTAPESCPLN